MSLDYSPEVLRQHTRYKEIRARLNAGSPAKELPTEFVNTVDNTKVDEARISNWFGQCHTAFEALAHEPIISEPKISVICSEVRKQFGVGRMDFESARRRQEFVVPRQVAMALSKHLTRNSLPEIGRRIGDRDHTTVLHACRKYQPVLNEVVKKVPDHSPIQVWVAAFKVEIALTEHAKRKPHVRRNAV